MPISLVNLARSPLESLGPPESSALHTELLVYAQGAEEHQYPSTLEPERENR